VKKTETRTIHVEYSDAEWEQLRNIAHKLVSNPSDQVDIVLADSDWELLNDVAYTDGGPVR
jgi:hypothetical protein